MACNRTEMAAVAAAQENESAAAAESCVAKRELHHGLPMLPAFLWRHGVSRNGDLHRSGNRCNFRRYRRLVHMGALKLIGSAEARQPSEMRNRGVAIRDLSVNFPGSS